MPNHVHCILHFPSEDFDLNKIVSNGKRFMAYEMIKRLQAQEKSWLLADDYSLYEHSSATFYEHQRFRHFCPVHYRDL